MVDGKSPEWLPPGFSEKVKYKDGRKIKYYQNVATGAKYRSKKDVLNSATAEIGLLSTPQTTTNKDDNVLSSNNKADAKLAITNDSPEWLPNGWKIDEKHRKCPGGKGSVYKVYTDLSTGSKFYSKPAVTRYLSSINHAKSTTLQNKVQMSLRSVDKNLGHKLSNVDETVEAVIKMSPKPTPTTHVGPTSENKKKGSSFKTLDNVDKTVTNMSPKPIPTANVGPTSENKRKFKTVACEIVAADDLPPGWIKEIITSKSGNKTRKDPYFTDPVSGYVFRSKLDVERYLKTKDIRSCACRPKTKDEFDQLKLIENDIPSSNPANEKSPDDKTELLVGGGEINGGEEASHTKTRARSYPKITNETKETEVIAVDESKKSKKRKEFSSPPSRASKRLAKCEPEFNSVLSERSRRSSRSEITSLPLEPYPSVIIPPQPSSDTVEANEPEKEALKVVETPQEIEPLNVVENEKPPAEEPIIQQEQIVGENANWMQINEANNNKKSEESQLLYDFGDSWSDPLEFALKTLRGDIPIEETLRFTTGGFGYQNNGNYNNQENGGLRSSQSNGGPVFFKDEFAPRPESSSKQNGGASAVDKLAGNSSSLFSQGNIVKRDWPSKFNP